MSNAMCLEMKSKFGLIIFNPFVSIVYVSDSSHLFFFFIPSEIHEDICYKNDDIYSNSVEWNLEGI